MATWSEHSEVGYHYEDLLADDSVIAWTEPPFDKSLYSGDDGPARTPICGCPRIPREFSVECAGCATCGQCSGPHVWPPLQT
ncbi:hypothetical protein A7J05_35965 [Streptomyces alfalfae]|uniref:Uncharacterized protein n=1 Tax=Streptomyces alfalfae TaxID=1642299 RepID=A0ABN4VUS8_9ACTN|nr:hypothetical protein A7J05_35965 [Streptomyces alfalfae]AYA20804.1 hypothetical protein D3X13_35380 [Streptomyces fradiae]